MAGIDDYQAMRQDPAPLPFLPEAAHDRKLEPGVYEVVEPSHPPASELKRLRFVRLRTERSFHMAHSAMSLAK